MKSEASDYSDPLAQIFARIDLLIAAGNAAGAEAALIDLQEGLKEALTVRMLQTQVAIDRLQRDWSLALFHCTEFVDQMRDSPLCRFAYALSAEVYQLAGSETDYTRVLSNGALELFGWAVKSFERGEMPKTRRLIDAALATYPAVVENPTVKDFLSHQPKLRDLLPSGAVVGDSLESAPTTPTAPKATEPTEAPPTAKQPAAPEPYLRDRRPDDPEVLRKMQEAEGFFAMGMLADAANAMAAVPDAVKEKNRIWWAEFELALAEADQRWTDLEGMARAFMEFFPHRVAGVEALIAALKGQKTEAHLAEAEAVRKRSAGALWELGASWAKSEEWHDLAKHCLAGAIELMPGFKRALMAKPHLRQLFENPDEGEISAE